MDNPKPKIIYLVDDDEDDRFFLIQAMREVSMEITVIEMTGGKALLDYFEQIHDPVPGLIVLDLYMPTMDGLETMAKIKAHPKIARFPIIIMSTMSEHIPRWLRHGLHDIHWHKKPDTFTGYVTIVERFLLDFSSVNV